MIIKTEIQPFNNCPALDGYHCQTNSLAKIFNYNNHPLSEDMLLGLGSGMGFIYWKMKMGANTYLFIGGRGNNKNFFDDIGKRTGVKINTISTSSNKKAELSLLENLKKKIPVMVFGDMGFLPWFKLPKDYHFGGHTFVICGYDGEKTVLASDMDNEAGGLKKGFYHPITLEQLRKARSSAFKPFPPKNTFFEFDFKDYHPPTKNDIYTSIKKTIESQLNPPIKNLGVKGIKYASSEIVKWPIFFNDFDLRMSLFSLYIFFEIGGTGGGCFRHMFSRFLKESAEITKNKGLIAIGDKFKQSGEMFTKIGMLFKDAEKAKDFCDKIDNVSHIFSKIAELEEETFMELSKFVK
ncbi:TPA: DUF4872 domain-containing protein [bacterium]|nr:DUF4872 domain-containing protein [bacterium]